MIETLSADFILTIFPASKAETVLITSCLGFLSPSRTSKQDAQLSANSRFARSCHPGGVALTRHLAGVVRGARSYFI